MDWNAYQRVWHHGPDIDADWARMWQEQEGNCYLCVRPLPEPAAGHMDHDHRCCGPGRSCSSCRRGITCGNCNKLTGLAGDDPDLIRIIAGNLEFARAAVDKRIADAPEQMELWETERNK